MTVVVAAEWAEVETAAAEMVAEAMAMVVAKAGETAGCEAAWAEVETAGTRVGTRCSSLHIG